MTYAQKLKQNSSNLSRFAVYVFVLQILMDIKIYDTQEKIFEHVKHGWLMITEIYVIIAIIFSFFGNEEFYNNRQREWQSVFVSIFMWVLIWLFLTFVLKI